MKFKVCQLLVFIFLLSLAATETQAQETIINSQTDPLSENTPEDSEIYREGQHQQGQSVQESNSQNQQGQSAQEGTHHGGQTQGNAQEGQGQHGQSTHEQHHSHYHKPSEAQFWINLSFAGLLTCIGGFCSGLTVGLMSIETIQLEMMSLSKNQEQQKIGKRILSVVKDHHLFLVTLLLANAMALQSLPLVVHSLMPDWAAILFSTFIVLIIGQIIPQAYCTGPKKITIAYYAAPIILVMIKVLWILGKPMAKGLDYLLGVHGHHRIQHKDFANFLKGGSQNIPQTQMLLLTSILELRMDRVNFSQMMVPLDKLYMLQSSERLTSQKVAQINKKDYSYILVYKQRRSNLIGVIKTKQFALKYLASGNKTMMTKDVVDDNHQILNVFEDTNLLQMLMLFQAKSYRYAVVIGKKKKIVPGIQSIMYSKSDMIAKSVDGEVLGVIFLYRIFEQIAQYNNQVQSGNPKPHHQEPIEMNQLNKPLLNN